MTYTVANVKVTDHTTSGLRKPNSQQAHIRRYSLHVSVAVNKTVSSPYGPKEDFTSDTCRIQRRILRSLLRPVEFSEELLTARAVPNETHDLIGAGLTGAVNVTACTTQSLSDTSEDDWAVMPSTQVEVFKAKKIIE